MLASQDNKDEFNALVKKQQEKHPANRLVRPWRSTVVIGDHNSSSQFCPFCENYNKFGKFKRNQCAPNGEIVATFFTTTKEQGEYLTRQLIGRCVDKTVDIAELFSPPRISKLGQEKFGFAPGGCFDLRTGYDLTKPEVRRQVWQRLKE